MIVLSALSSLAFFQKMSNNTGGTRDGNNLWDQLFGREGSAQRGTTHNVGNSSSCNEATSHDVDVFGSLLRIQARARAVQQYQRERVDLDNQLSIMHSLVSSGLPFNATNPSMPSNDTTFSARSSSMPSNFTHSAGVQHSTILSNDCHDGSEVHPAVVKPLGNSSRVVDRIAQSATVSTTKATHSRLNTSAPPAAATTPSSTKKIHPSQKKTSLN